MKHIGQKFNSFADAQKAEIAYMKSLTAQERFDIAYEIRIQVHGDLSNCLDVREYERTKRNEH